MAALNSSRSSAVRMASALAPISSGVPGVVDRAALDELHGQVQRGLAAEGREHRVGRSRSMIRMRTSTSSGST